MPLEQKDRESAALVRFCATAGNPWRVEWRVERRLRRLQRPFSRVVWYRLRGSGGTRDIVVKTTRSAGRAQARPLIAREVTDAARFAAMSADPRVSVLAPLAAYEDLGVLITEAVHARNVAEVVEACVRTWRPEPVGPAEDACRLAGHWLRQVQSGTGEPEVLRTPERLLEPLRVRVERLVAHGGFWGLNRKDAHRILEWADSLSRALPAADQRMARAHGDFGPGNLLFDGERLLVLDFTTAHENCILLDPTRFVHQLQLLRLKPAVRHDRLARLQTAFLEGYGRPELRGTQGYFLFMARHSLTHWSGRARHRSKHWWSRLYDRWVCLHHRRTLLQYVAGGVQQVTKCPHLPPS